MTSKQPVDDSPGYTITGQVEEMRQQPNQAYIDGVKVSFTTDTGVAGTVWVPAAKYNRDDVRAAIVARVAIINSVQSLGS